MEAMDEQKLENQIHALRRRTMWYNGLIIILAAIVLVFEMGRFIGYPPIDTSKLRVIDEARTPLVIITDRPDAEKGIWIQQGTETLPQIFLGFENGDQPVLRLIDEEGTVKRFTVTAAVEEGIN
ncbi:hypothetical protein GF373_05520 [bacterium]|nr:hypothetical protein [bacterium]